MPQLLLEVGCEELPAHSVLPAAEALLRLVLEAVVAEGLAAEPPPARWAATPRRLIVSVDGVAERQPDRQVERRGPSKSAAFDAAGNPTKALEGFCRGAGVSPADVEVRDDYVWVSKLEEGKPAVEVLGPALVAAIRQIPFEKTMRWGVGRTRFARPIRWIVALVGGEVIEFEVEGVSAGRASRGHRFLSPDSFEVTGFDDLLLQLRERFVEPEPERRRERIVSGAKDAAQGSPLMSSDLIEENVYLTEWPTPVAGAFREEFLSLPRPVLVAAMAHYQRFFPVESKPGELTNRFISITNGGDEATVRQGNEWVLNARFNDAKFFYDEDQRHTLDEFLLRTERIVFQEKLGTVRQRADRIARMAALLAEQAELAQDAVERARRAGLYAKADLSTGLVSELPSLQGQIGAEYARREGFPGSICRAIERHYSPDAASDEEGERLATLVMCADQSDRLAGYLGIGELPSGSKDPFALRRSVALLVEAQMSWPFATQGVAEWVVSAGDGYAEQGIELRDSLSLRMGVKEVLEGRYEHVFSDLPHDALDAAWAVAWNEPSHRFAARVRFLASIANDTEFIRLAKRAGNIVSAARRKGIEVPESREDAAVRTDLFESEAEVVLYEQMQVAEEEMDALPVDAFGERTEVLRALKPNIELFFDDVMVMTDDAERRDNRLALLSRVDQLARSVADFSRFVIEGE
ncbi:MAG: glycine--tRNA ligase subunit beta [Armatimonadota bacterium]